MIIQLVSIRCRKGVRRREVVILMALGVVPVVESQLSRNSPRFREYFGLRF